MYPLDLVHDNTTKLIQVNRREQENGDDYQNQI